jgi:hypothetical protein
MAKYEAVVSITVEFDAKDSDSADQLILGELTARLLETASRDNKFKMWLNVEEIEEMD